MTVTLVVSPTRAVQELLTCCLARRYDAVVAVGTLGEALDAVSVVAPDVVIVDHRAEGNPGEYARLMDACSNGKTRIVCLAGGTADRQRLIDHLDGREPLILAMPCTADELLDAAARARPLGQELAAIVSLGPLVVYTEEGRLEGPHGTVHLTAIELGILTHLLRRNGIPASAHELLDKVWGQPEVNGSGSLVRAHVRNLRAKLRRTGLGSDIVRTFPRRGYAIAWNHERAS